jgi:polyisoprenoid-binding protein YceI
MTTATLPTTTTTWNVDPTHANVGFAVRHLMISTVRGSFGDVAGTISIDGEDPTTAKAEITVGVPTIDTRNAQRDEHLKSADFFDAANFPVMAFQSTGVKKKSDDIYAVTGNLTIRGTTKPVTLAVTIDGTGNDPWGNARAAWSGTTTIDRRDWGLTWNQALEAGGVAVGHDIKISFEIEAVRAAA